MASSGRQMDVESADAGRKAGIINRDGHGFTQLLEEVKSPDDPVTLSTKKLSFFKQSRRKNGFFGECFMLDYE
jgi:hypothetical protein